MLEFATRNHQEGRGMTANRDYAGDMRKVIDEMTQGPEGYNSRAVAEQIVTKLLMSDTDLLHGWLEVHAIQLIRHAINMRDASQRTTARTRARSEDFRMAAAAAEQGD